MAAFEFPKIDLHSFRVDNVAAAILPEEAQSGYLPVMVKCDGNCLFWSASVFCIWRRQPTYNLKNFNDEGNG